jgi:hypothetical protein
MAKEPLTIVGFIWMKTGFCNQIVSPPKIEITLAPMIKAGDTFLRKKYDIKTETAVIAKREYVAMYISFPATKYAVKKANTGRNSTRFPNIPTFAQSLVERNTIGRKQAAVSTTPKYQILSPKTHIKLSENE